jgi:HD superfamily phosphohydrolase
MLDTIFPTATHTRFQHTLGSYHAATLYLAALYYDPENPLFRALIDIGQCKALLVAMLIHDIGHTAYGHELEEIDSVAFGHRYYVDVLVKSQSFKDAKGRTLREIIEGTDDGCWGVPFTTVLQLFDRPTGASAPFHGVLHDIMDSQIDADKFDYLVRDSIEGRVSYGFGIDLDRFLRSLTTYALEDGTLRLAIKQKGAPAAEAFAHSRYQLYQSMYWHHAFRATKAMLVEAIQRIQEDLRSTSPDMFDKYPFRTGYIQHVLGAADYMPARSTGDRRRKKETATPSASDKIEASLKKQFPIFRSDTETMRSLHFCLDSRTHRK